MRVTNVITVLREIEAPAFSTGAHHLAFVSTGSATHELLEHGWRHAVQRRGGEEILEHHLHDAVDLSELIEVTNGTQGLCFHGHSLDFTGPRGQRVLE